MATTINADTSEGLKLTSDTSGEIELQSGGEEIVTVNSNGIEMANGKTISASALTGTFPTIDASASGIYLGGTASSNLLDNYEEGSWTPSLTAVTPVTSVTYTHRSGKYIRIGSLVYVTGAFQISARSGGSGQVIVGGLPFNVQDVLPSTAVEASGYCSYFGGLTQATSAIGVWAFNGSTNLYFTSIDPAGSTTMPKLEITNTSETSFQLRFTISYITDDE